MFGVEEEETGEIHHNNPENCSKNQNLNDKATDSENITVEQSENSDNQPELGHLCENDEVTQQNQ